MSQYATLADLVRLGAGGDALAGPIPTDADKNAALVIASAVADGYLASRFKAPLLAWGDDIRRAVCLIAAYDLLAGLRGFNPEAGSNINARLRYQDAVDWLKDVAADEVHPTVTDSSADPNTSSGVRVYSNPKRGW